MTVSYSDQSEKESGIGNQESAELVRGSVLRAPRPTFRFSRQILIVVAAYVAAHLIFLAPSLEDIDSINFALGLRHFDVANHQPHPPGYPVYLALGHVSCAISSWTGPALDPARLAARALAIWSALGGALALIAA